MAGAIIAIDDAADEDTILSVKQRVFALNNKLFVRRQRLVYSAGPRGMDALADDETLGGAGVARDGTAELDVLVADLTAAEAAELGEKVWSFFLAFFCVALIHCFVCVPLMQFPLLLQLLVLFIVFVCVFSIGRRSFVSLFRQ